MKTKPWEKVGVRFFKSSSSAFKEFKTKDFRLPDGKVHSFDLWYVENGWVGVFALTTELEVITATSFRPGPERVLDEMPLGLVDPGEEPKESARRELLEETGWVPGEMITLGENMAWMPYADGDANYYLALGCTHQKAQELGDSEHIEVRLIPLREYVSDVLRKGLTSHAECAWLAIDYMIRNNIITYDDIS